jgi:hypothetical protein
VVERYRQSKDYRGVNFDAAEKARDARYRNPHSIAFTDIPRYHRVDDKAGILNAISNLAASNPFGANPDAQRSKKYVSTAGMSRDALQTLYGNIIPPAPYLRKYDQYFDPSQNLFERGIGAMIDDIKDSRTMDILKFLLKY